MIEELRKRPFVRPLFCWISGILLYTFLPLSGLLAGLAGVFLLLLLILSLSWWVAKAYPTYESRWAGGLAIVWAFVALSIAVCRYVDMRADVRVPHFGWLQEQAAGIQAAGVARVDQLKLTDVEKSVVAALTLGYRQAMGRDTRACFSAAGVAHVLAVSGFHVAVVCAFLTLLCRFLPRRGWGGWLRYLFQIGALWSYAFITGLAPSAIRAALMLTLYLTGRFMGRLTDGYNTLAASAFCMLAYDPSYLFDIGFQLSYLAVLSLLFGVPRLRGLIDVRNPLLARLWEWIVVSLSAQLGTSLLCLYYFKQISLVFLFTNPPVTLLAMLLLPLAGIWICYPADYWGADYLQTCVEVLVRALLRVVNLFGHLPYASFSYSPF